MPEQYKNKRVTLTLNPLGKAKLVKRVGINAEKLTLTEIRQLLDAERVFTNLAGIPCVVDFENEDPAASGS